MTSENDNWLEISSEDVKIEELKRKIQKRLDSRDDVVVSVVKSPEILTQTLHQQMIGDFAPDVEQGNAIQLTDVDIVPRDYVIDWQNPILGPPNAVIRRVINAEIQRYLLQSLEKQSVINRHLLDIVQKLVEENKTLRREIDKYREDCEL